MSHLKHTPGPWAFDADDFTEIYSEDSAALVCKVLEADDFPCLEEGTHGDVQDECLANARLIAAAPVMDELLRRLIKWDTDFPVNSSNGYAGLKELDGIIADAKAAIGSDDL